MGFVSDLWNGLTGQTAAEAALQGGEIQSQGISDAIAASTKASQEGQGYLKPFEQVGQQGLANASFLTDPNQQFQFLQSNPLFKYALENANRTTQNQAAAGGRLSAGDTLQQLSNNVLLSASPLIQQQKGSIMDLINTGAGVAGAQANTAIGSGNTIADLIGSGAAANAAGVVGAGNARTQGSQNLLTTGILAGALSDLRLKTNLKHKGKLNGHNIYSWTWNELANKLGLEGDGVGVIAQYVYETNPEAVISNGEYLKVDYSKLGLIN